jgi:ElaB/YqjD/DUF883 family membrane-anchored ribosome-binding protein
MTIATDLSNAGHQSVDTAAERAHRAVDSARQKAAPALQRAAGAAHRTIDKVSAAATPAAQWISDSGKQLGTRSTQLADACSDRVRARPIVSVAAALAIGYFVGKFLQR